MATLVNLLRPKTPPEAEIYIDFRETYFALRSAAGLIGVVLPFVLVVWGLAHDIAWNQMTSLSAFYWLSMLPPVDSNALLRNWFVGSLLAVGTCLIVYRGYGPSENRLLDVAGGAALVVALWPMPWPQLHADRLHIHYTAAVLFFLTIAATIWFCADDTLSAVSNANIRARWRRIYKTYAIAMVAAPLLAIVFAREGQRTILIEALGVWVFSGYWFVKTYELSKVSELEPRSGPAPQVIRIGDRLEVVRVEGTGTGGFD